MDDIVVFAVASNGTVEQWDGHATTAGILLRWFTDPALGYPQLGFEIYRTQIGDGFSILFDDLNVPGVQGKTSWNYLGIATLSCVSGLQFTRGSKPGRWNLVIAPGAPVVVTFSSPAFRVSVASAGGANVTVIGRAGGAEVLREELIGAGAILRWRTRGLHQIELSGDGLVSEMGCRLLQQLDGRWGRLAHRCLPVFGSTYRCAPQPTRSEESEARSRLPTQVAAQWAARFARPWAALLPAIRRAAHGAPAAAIPPDKTRPDVKISGDERAILDLSALDPHGARILGLAYDDPLNGNLDGREYAYKIVGRWLGASNVVEGAVRRQLDAAALRKEHGIELSINTGGLRGSDLALRFQAVAHDVSVEFNTNSSVHWVAEDGEGNKLSGKTPSGPTVLQFPQVRTIAWIPDGADLPVLTALQWTPIVERTGLLLDARHTKIWSRR